MTFALTPEQRDMVTSVRALAQKKFRSRAMRWMDGTFPWENIADLAGIGDAGHGGARGVRRHGPAGA